MLDQLTVKLLKICLLAIFTALLSFIMIRYAFLFLPFVLAYFLSYLLQPCMHWLVHISRISYRISASIVVTIWLFFHGALFYIVIYKIYNETAVYLDNIPSSYLQIKEWLNTQSFIAYEEIVNKLPFISSIMEYFFQLFERTNLSHLLSMLDGSASVLLSFLVTFRNIAFGFIVFIIALYMIAIDFKRITRYIQQLIPSKLSKQLRNLYKAFWRTLLRLSIAQFTLSSITAIICFIGFIIISFPKAMLTSFLLFSIDIIPYIGVGLFFLPLVSILVWNGDTMTAIGMLIIYCIVLMFRQIMEPKVIGILIGLHPLLVLFVFFIIIQTFGLIGFFIGPFIIILLTALIHAKTFQMLWQYIDKGS